MAKILFFNVPAHGHVNATLPLVAQLVQRSHEVIYYCGHDFQQTIEKTGARFRPYPHPELKHLNQAMASAVVKNMANIAPLLLKTTEIITEFVLSEIACEKPDLLMHDSITFWGHIAAHVSGIPNVVTYSNLALEGIKLEMNWRIMAQFAMGAFFKVPSIVRSRNRLSKKYGPQALKSPLFPTKGVKNLVFMAREFQPPTSFVDASFVFVGPSIDPTMREDSAWTPIEADAPLVYISLGTINNQNLGFYEAVFAAFADYPVQVLMSIGRSLSIEQLPAIPSNVIIKASVPQLQVLQQADVFITHGGMNSVQEALYYGVPQIVVPQQIEQLINGVQVAKLGAGLLLGDHIPLGQVTAAELRDALDTVLHDPRYKHSAAHLKQASRTAGGYQRAADEVESLLHSHKRERMQSMPIAAPSL